MALKVTLVPNTIQQDGSMVPRVVHRDFVSFSEVVDEMAKTTGLSRDDLRLAASKMWQTIADLLAKGYRVETEFGSFVVNVKRSKWGDTDTNGNNGDGETNGNDNANGRDRRIDASGIHISFRANPDYLDQIRDKTRLDVITRPSFALPQIDHVENQHRPNTFNTGAPGELINIEGGRLSFQPHDTETGVFFINADGTQETRCEVYGRTGSKFTLFLVPELDPGEYKLEVRTRPSTKDVRVGTAEQPFIVTQAT